MFYGIPKFTLKLNSVFFNGSQIKGKNTFYLRKMHIEQMCDTSGEGCKVTGK